MAEVSAIYPGWADLRLAFYNEAVAPVIDEIFGELEALNVYDLYEDYDEVLMDFEDYE